MNEEKLSIQKIELEKLKQQFENETVASGTVYTIEELQKLLRSIPISIFNQGNKVVECLIDFKNKKRELRKVYSSKLLEANFDHDLKSAGERKAWVENSQEYLSAEEELILSEGNYKASDLHLEAYNNLFTAVKKAASLITEQDKAQSRNY